MKESLARISTLAVCLIALLVTSSTLAYADPAVSLRMTVKQCIPDPNDPVDITCREECEPSVDSLVLVPGVGTGVVAGGHRLIFCYQITNVGTQQLNLHDLYDSESGAILTNFPFALGIGASGFITRRVTVSEDKDFSAVWNAYNAGPTQISKSADRVLVRIDTDGDGIADERDLCPNDAAKTEGHICGCGVPDADLNGNGIVDCLEGGEVIVSSQGIQLRTVAIQERVRTLRADRLLKRAGKTRQNLVKAEISAILASIADIANSAVTEIPTSGPASVGDLLADAQAKVTAALNTRAKKFPRAKKLALAALGRMRAALD